VTWDAVAPTITAIATLVAACGALVAAIAAAFVARRNAKRADNAADKAAEAAVAAKAAKEQLVIIDGQIRKLGDAVDGRLTALLAATVQAAEADAKAARAGGYAAGEQAQRDRDSVSPEVGRTNGSIP
jgi:predicted alpha/beta-hydrolase family hydrolase